MMTNMILITTARLTDEILIEWETACFGDGVLCFAFFLSFVYMGSILLFHVR